MEKTAMVKSAENDPNCRTKYWMTRLKKQELNVLRMIEIAVNITNNSKGTKLTNNSKGLLHCSVIISLTIFLFIYFELVFIFMFSVLILLQF